MVESLLHVFTLPVKAVKSFKKGVLMMEGSVKI